MALDLAGKKFGKLRAIEFTGESKKNQGRMWRCICDCGNTKEISAGVLNSGHSKSCGCIVIDRIKALGMTNFKHGEGHGRKTKEYRAWTGMKERCYGANHCSFADYGGRGIRVCERWRNDYSTFLKDMGRAEPEQSLDRIDVNGDYSPDNCRWACAKTQMRNRRNTKFIELNGKQYRAVELADELGVTRNAIYVFESIRKRLKEKYGFH